MKLNGEKFQHLRYGHSAHLGSYTAPGNDRITSVDEAVDLGVLMEGSGKFAAQIRSAAQKGRRAAGWVLRVFNTRDERPMLTLFKSLVLSAVEYCSVLWSPQRLGLIRELEDVQRAFTRKITGVQHLDYGERLEKLKLFSLERRRDRFRIIYVWRIINGLSPNLDDDRYRINILHSARRGLECRIPALRQTSQSLKTLNDESFAVAGPMQFNCIDKNVRNHTGSLDSFKSKLDKFLWTVPDRPVIVGQQQAINCNRLDVRVSEMRRRPNNST